MKFIILKSNSIDNIYYTSTEAFLPKEMPHIWV